MVKRCVDRCMVGSDKGGRSYLAHGLPALRHNQRALPRHYRSRPNFVVGIIQNRILTFSGLWSCCLSSFFVWKCLVDLACDPEMVHQYGELSGECYCGLSFSFAFS